MDFKTTALRITVLQQKKECYIQSTQSQVLKSIVTWFILSNDSTS